MDDNCSSLFNSFISTQNMVITYLTDIKEEQKQIKKEIKALNEKFDLYKEGYYE